MLVYFKVVEGCNVGFKERQYLHWCWERTAGVSRKGKIYAGCREITGRRWWLFIGKLKHLQIWENLKMPAEKWESIPQEAKFYGICFLSEKGGNIERHFRKLCRIGKNKSKWSENIEISSESTAEISKMSRIQIQGNRNGKTMEWINQGVRESMEFCQNAILILVIQRPPTLNSAQTAKGSQIYRKIYSPTPEECEFWERQDFSFTQRVNWSCLSRGRSHRFLEV